MKICTCVIDKINKIKMTTETIKNYLTDPVATLEKDVSKVQLGTNVLPEEVTRNILVGVSSENTKQYALGLGKRHLVDSLNNQVKEVSNYLKNKVEMFKSYGKKIDNSLKAIDSVYTDGVVDTRIMDIKDSDLYRNYFKTRLENDFLPTLNGSNYKMSITLDMNKVILIIRHFLQVEAIKSDLTEFSNVFSKFTTLMETFSDVKRIEAIIPNEELDLVEGVDEQPFDVAILNKQAVGNMLMEVAKVVPELDTTQVDVVESVILLLDKFNVCYDKLTADVQAVTHMLNNQYPDDMTKALDVVEKRITEVADNYIEVKTTDDEFNRIVTNSINSLIRLLSLDSYITEVTTDTANRLANDVSTFIGFYHLYRDIVMHSMKLGKTRSKAAVMEKE